MNIYERELRTITRSKNRKPQGAYESYIYIFECWNRYFVNPLTLVSSSAYIQLSADIHTCIYIYKTASVSSALFLHYLLLLLGYILERENLQRITRKITIKSQTIADISLPYNIYIFRSAIKTLTRLKKRRLCAVAAAFLQTKFVAIAICPLERER